MPQMPFSVGITAIRLRSEAATTFSLKILARRLSLCLVVCSALAPSPASKKKKTLGKTLSVDTARCELRLLYCDRVDVWAAGEFRAPRPPGHSILFLKKHKIKTQPSLTHTSARGSITDAYRVLHTVLETMQYFGWKLKSPLLPRNLGQKTGDISRMDPHTCVETEKKTRRAAAAGQVHRQPRPDAARRGDVG